jgi:hypothetical protein
MKVALQIVKIHALLVIVLWLLAHVDSAFECGGLCGPVSYASALAFFILILPGFKTVGLLIPYAIDEPGIVSFFRDFASLITTDVALFALVFVLFRLVTYVRNQTRVD